MTITCSWPVGFSMGESDDVDGCGLGLKIEILDQIQNIEKFGH